MNDSFNFDSEFIENKTLKMTSVEILLLRILGLELDLCYFHEIYLHSSASLVVIVVVKVCLINLSEHPVSLFNFCNLTPSNYVATTSASSFIEKLIHLLVAEQSFGKMN